MSPVEVIKPPTINIQAIATPNVLVIAAGNLGPPGLQGPQGIQGVPGPEGPQGQWEALTQSEYNALDPPNPDTLYVIIA